MTGTIAFDESTIESLRDILHKSTEAVLVGPRDSGKTVTAKVLGFKLLTQNRFTCFYGNARDLTDVTDAITQIQAYEAFSNRTLFILEDCHTSTNLMKVETLFQRFGRDRYNTALLLITRYLGPDDSILRTIAQEGGVVRPNPEKLRVHIARKHIEQLSLQPAYANSPHFPKREADIEAQISGLLARLPQKNLRVLDLYLQAWNPITESLAEVEERKVLERLLAQATPATTSLEAQACLLPLCAIDQYEVGIHLNFFDDRNALQQLKDRGIVNCSDRTGLCKLPDPSEAPWYLKAAEQARLLQVQGWPTNVASYVRHHVLKYAAMAPNPQDLLRALRDDRSLAQAVVEDPGFRTNISRLATEQLFRADLPDLLVELRLLKNIDLCLDLCRLLTDGDLHELSKMGVDILGRYLGEFLSLGEEGRQCAQRLITQQSAQPRAIAIDFMTGLGSGRYGVIDVARLLFVLNKLGTYDVRSLLNSLDLPRLRAKFPETRLDQYAALFRHIKWAKAGTALVRALTPPIEMIVSRVKSGSARELRDIMDALLMPDRKQLWRDLTDEDLREVIGRSTLNQFHNFLVDSLESKNKESIELGKEIATRLVDLDLSRLIAKTGLKDVSMFVHAAVGLNPALAGRLLDQILQAGLREIITEEKNKGQVISKISFMQGDFSAAPDVAHRFLSELTQLDLLNYILVSSPEGLRYLTYWALMADKELSRKWFLTIDRQTWKDKLREAPEEETFWLLLNIFQVAPDVACSLANVTEIHEKLAGVPYGLGMLLLCGAEVGNVAAILPRVPPVLVEPWVSSKLALTFRALCHPDLREEALRLKASLDLRKAEDTFQNARILPQTRDLFMRILTAFKELA